MSKGMSHIFKDETDEFLIGCVLQGDDQALACIITRYTPLLKSAVSKVFNDFYDWDDMMQEATLGLIKAIKNYNSERGTFSAFAKLCVETELFSYIRLINKKSAIPPDKIVELNDDIHGSSDPQDIYITKEEISGIKEKVKSTLSDLEYAVMRSYMMGESYENIAKELDITVKAVDNAVQRIRRKLK